MNNSFSHNRIALIGPFGFGNLGDAAIQDSMIQNIRERCPRVDIYGISQNPTDTTFRHNIPAFPISRVPRRYDENKSDSIKKSTGMRVFFETIRNRLLFKKVEKALVRAPLEIVLFYRAYRNMKGFNLLVISGGGQLDDYWGGAWSHPYALLKWCFIARMRKAKVLFVSVGAGPIDSPLSKRFIKYALSLATYRSYRDEESKKMIESIGMIKSGLVCPDLAYGIRIPEKKSSVHSYKYKPIVGIGPMTYFHPQYWPRRDYTIYMNYLKKLASFTAWLLENGSTIVLFPGEIGADQIAMKDLKDILIKDHVSFQDGQIIQNSITTVDELMTTLASTDYIIASRFHGVLLAHVVCKPVLAISYHQKIDSLMREVGHSNFCVNIDRFEDIDLRHRFKDLQSSADVLRSQIEKKTDEYRKSLNVQFDEIVGKSGISE